jgi:HEPN domain-containing protein
MGYLDAAGEDLDAARRLLASPPNRLAFHHLQQAAEKLAKALLTSRDVHPGREHRLGLLALQLPTGDPWHGVLSGLAHLDRFATAFRYPGTTGRLPSGSAESEARADLARLEELLQRARRELEG